MLRVLFTGVGAFVDGLQPHDLHQPPYTVAARMEPVSGQICCDLAAAKERIFGERPVDFVHQLQRFSVYPYRLVIQR